MARLSTERAEPDNNIGRLSRYCLLGKLFGELAALDRFDVEEFVDDEGEDEEDDESLGESGDECLLDWRERGTAAEDEWTTAPR